MKNIFYLSLSFILFSCQFSQQKTTKNILPEADSDKNIYKQDSFKTIQLKLDTTTTFQSKYLVVDDSLFFGLEKFMTDASFGNDLGYIIFLNGNGLFAALIRHENGRHKVLGVTKIPNLKGKEKFVQGLYPESIREFKTFGIVEVNGDKVKTIRVWRVNNEYKCIEQLNPETVDFTESYYTDTD